MGQLHAPGGFGSNVKTPDELSLTSISPTSGQVLAVVTCVGKRFRSNSVVNFAGSTDMVPTYISEYQLTFVVPSDASEAAHAVSITTAADSGKVSNAINFTVTA